MRELTFEYNGLKITVREELGSDVWDEESADAVLGSSVEGHPVWRLGKFYACVIRTTKIEGDLPFEWPTSCVDRRIITAYEGWRALPKALLKLWDEELKAVNAAGDPDLKEIEPGKSLPPPPPPNE